MTARSTGGTAPATLRGLLGIFVLGMAGVLVGTFTIHAGRDDVCAVVEVLPTVECGPVDAPDGSVGAAALLVGLGFVGLSVARWRVLRRWRAAVAGSSGGGRARSYWPISLLRGALAVAAPALLLGLSVTVHHEGAVTQDRSLHPAALGFFGALTLGFAAASTSWRWRRTLGKAIGSAGSRSLDDVLAAGGGWCAFVAGVGGLADGRPGTPAPFDGRQCVAWAVGANVIRKQVEQVRRPKSDYGMYFQPTRMHDFDENGVRINEKDLNPGSGETLDHYLVSVTTEWLDYVYVESSREPFTVHASDTQLVALPETLHVGPREVGRFRINRRRHGEWYDLIRERSQERSRGDITATLGVLVPGEQVTVRGWVFPYEGRWCIGSLAVAAPHLPSAGAPELDRELETSVVVG